MTPHLQQISGAWWPAAPSAGTTTQGRPGTLTFSLPQGGRLTLDGPRAGDASSPADAAVFHGARSAGGTEQAEEPITLLGVTSLEQPAERAPTREFVVDTVLRGAHVASGAEHRFSEATAEVPELAPWMAHRRWDPTGSDAPSSPVQIAVPCLTTEAPDAHALQISVARAPQQNRADAAAGPAPVSVRLSADGDGLSVEEVRRHFHAVQDLITLATLAPPAPLAATLRAEGQGLAAELFWRQSLACAGVDAAEGSLLFSCEDAPFETTLPRWYELRRRHRATVDLFMGTLCAPHRFSEMNLLVLVAAAEALFATTDDRSKRQRKDSTLRIKLGTMAERVNLQKRVSTSLPVPEWAERAARVRNSFTHTGGTSGYSHAQLEELTGITAAVVVFNLLHDLGIPAEAWSRGFARNPLLRRLSAETHSTS